MVIMNSKQKTYTSSTLMYSQIKTKDYDAIDVNLCPRTVNEIPLPHPPKKKKLSNRSLLYYSCLFNFFALLFVTVDLLTQITFSHLIAQLLAPCRFKRQILHKKIRYVFIHRHLTLQVGSQIKL